jgi:hypothetical protein
MSDSNNYVTESENESENEDQEIIKLKKRRTFVIRNKHNVNLFLDELKYDLKSIIRIRIINSILISILNINKFINLDELYLDNSNIKDISALSPLIKLTVLSLNGNSISDISPLENLFNITYLYLDDNLIEDLSVIKNMKQIDELYFNNNKVSDISCLEDNVDIRVLSINNNLIKDISIIKNMKYLRKLDCCNNKISDASVLYNLTELRYVDLKNNHIKYLDISKLEINNYYRFSIYNNPLFIDLNFNVKERDVFTISYFPILFHNIKNYKKIKTFPNKEIKNAFEIIRKNNGHPLVDSIELDDLENVTDDVKRMLFEDLKIPYYFNNNKINFVL